MIKVISVLFLLLSWCAVAHAISYMALSETGYCPGNSGAVTLQPGQEQDFKPIYSPLAEGSGSWVNTFTFSFAVDNTKGTRKATVNSEVGVSNPSEHDCPMWPWEGTYYPDVVFADVTAGQRAFVTVHRFDTLSPLTGCFQLHGGADISNWIMNPGLNGGSDRAGYPQLFPWVKNVGRGPVTITDICYEAHSSIINDIR